MLLGADRVLFARCLVPISSRQIVCLFLGGHLRWLGNYFWPQGLKLLGKFVIVPRSAHALEFHRLNKRLFHEGTVALNWPLYLPYFDRLFALEFDDLIRRQISYRTGISITTLPIYACFVFVSFISCCAFKDMKLYVTIAEECADYCRFCELIAKKFKLFAFLIINA